MIKKLIFFAIFILTFFIRLDVIKGGNLPFTTDQGRDMIDIRGIAVGHKLRLIGPTTSINGVYLGPFWYYFNLPPFIVSGGDPSALLVWQIIWYQLAGLLLYLVIRRTNPVLAFFTSVLFLIMPLGFNTSRYSWNANAMPIFAALFFLCLYWVKRKPTTFRTFVLGLTAGLSFQIEAAFGIIFFPFSFLFLLVIGRKIKLHFYHLLGFVITLLPQAVFEFRHQFPLTKVFLTEISGHSSMLGASLSLPARLSDRITAATQMLQQTSHLPVVYLFPIFGVVSFITLFLWQRKYLSGSVSDLFSISIGFLIFATIFYLFFPQALKSWYLLGLSVPLVLVYASSITALFQTNDRLLKTGIIVLLAASLYFTYTAQSDYLKVAFAMGNSNKSSLKNSISAVDWVYQHAGDQGFREYSYLPSIYDYPYQYLFWWYGYKKYGYRGADIAYLPDQPEYIENMKTYFTNTKPLPADKPTFLIIEKEESNPQFQTAWLGNFSKLCQIDKVSFNYGVEIRKMTVCP